LGRSGYLVANRQDGYFGCNGGSDRFSYSIGGKSSALFANVTASLVDISALQPGTPQSTPTIQSDADAQALPPTARDAPTRDEIAGRS